MNNTFDKLTRFCLFRERCISEVNQKMYELNVKDEEKDELIKKLISEGYVNEDRYLQAFIHSKIYLKKWGKKKIESELILKKFDRKLIQQKLLEVDDEVYISNLSSTAEKKWATLYKKTLTDKRNALFRYMLSKGYEMDLVRDWVSTNSTN